MNFEELIEKLKNEYGISNGCYEVLKIHYTKLKLKRNNTDFYWLMGFIWGLCTTNYISLETREELEDILLHIDDMKGESL